MSLTKVTPAVIAVTNNITSNTFGSANTIPSFQIDGSGVIVAASNTAISLSANSVANNQFQTGSVENYMLAQGSSFGIRNKIMNGAMVIDQRRAGAAFTPGSNGLYSLDRWMCSVVNASSKFSVQRDSSANTVAGFTSSLKITSLSAYSVGATDIQGVQQKIEGYNVADLNWGTANAKPVTISFWVRSSLTGTFGAALQNGAVDRSYPFTYTIVAANTWEQKTITILGDTTGTWLTTNGIGLRINFSVGTGTTYSGTAGAWASGEYDSVTGAVSVVGTNGATWYITGVQLEKGTQSTPFEYRPFGKELMLCQRYYEKSFPVETAPAVNIMTDPTNCGAVGYASSAARSPIITFKVTKRVVPTMTLYSPNGYGGFTVNNFVIYNPGNAWAVFTSGSTISTVTGMWIDSSSSFSFTPGYAYLCAGDFAADAEL